MKLSITSKLDGIKSWSLEAGTTCPGSVGAEACKGCYAKSGNYRYPNAKAPRIHNRLDWERDDWVSDMVSALETERYFRWFDSGDMYHLKLAEKILSVMQQTPWVRHWLPTRMGKFPKFAPVLAKMDSLDNVKVRFSSDSINGDYMPWHGSVIIPSSNKVPSGAVLCGAYQNDGKCSGCRQCWDKSIPVIAYPAHGKSMTKLLSA